MKVVCIGNSIVKGFPHRQGQSFPSVLRERTGWQVINKGVNGDTTEMVLQRFRSDALAHRPDKIILLTGTNDFIYQTADPNQAMSNIRRMIELAEEQGVETVLLTPLPCVPKQAAQEWLAGGEADYERVNEELAKLADLIRAAAATKSCTVLDLGVEYKRFGKYHDGLHPTVEGQEWIARFIIEEILGEKKHETRESESNKKKD